MEPLNELTLKSLLDRSAENFADLPAVAYVDGEPITYREFYEQVQVISKLLHDRGIIAGDRVAILSENMPNWPLAYFAITGMGAVAVPILPDFHANEVHHILRHSGSKAAFVSSKLYDKLGNGEFESLQTRIMIDDFTTIPPESSTDRVKDFMQKGSAEFDKLREAALKMAGRISADVQEDDLAVIIYTSGTTGRSKGVMLSHRNIMSDAVNTLKIQHIDKSDRLISVLPLSHTYECTLGMILPLMQGASIYYLDKPPTARVLLPAMEKIKPTMILTVPLIIEKIYKMRILPKLNKNALMRGLNKIPLVQKKLHQIAGKKLMKTFGGELHFFGIGGAPLAPDVEKFLREANFPYAIGYGLTETSPLIAGCGPKVTRYRSTGPTLPGVEIRIEDPNPQTGEGEIVARGDNVMLGYYKDPERTREVLTEDGWFHTGDLGVFDEDGYLYIKGRLKNMILGPSGENIYPEEMEGIINDHDYVLESLVYQQDGQLMARVHLNYEELDKEFQHHRLRESQIQKRILDLLDDLRKSVNAQVSSFSRLNRIIEQQEPFEKTPTKKIKRYLYIG